MQDTSGLSYGNPVLLRETFEAGPLACNCTVLACGQTKQAVVVDPGGAVERISQILRHHDLKVKAIIHTHAHLDHILGTRDVHSQHGGDICLHPGDSFLYEGLVEQAAMFGIKTEPGLPVTKKLEDQEVIEFGDNKALVLHTPGHTPGSCCFEVRDGETTLLFSGDTLFRRSIGRTDLPGGNSRQLLQSIRERLYTRDLAATVVPGHGPTTTLFEESRKNPFVTLA